MPDDDDHNQPTPRHLFKRRLAATLALLLFAALLCLCRVEPNAYGVWTLTAPGVSVTALRDTYAGPVLWFYWAGEYRGQWKKGRWRPALPTMPTPYPTATPYPTSTPYPTPGRKMPLEGA